MMIRVFDQNDVFKILDITNTILREVYPATFFMNISRHWPEGFLIAEKDGEIVGFIMGVISDVRQSRILMLAVKEGHPAYHRW